MKLDRKRLQTVISQIKADVDTVVIQDTLDKPGYLDFIYKTKQVNTGTAHILRISCNMGSSAEEDLFFDEQNETLGEPIVASVKNLLKIVLKENTSTYELKDGLLNGIDIRILDEGDVRDYQGKEVKAIFESLKKKVENTSESIQFPMSKADYWILRDTLRKFVSHDCEHYPLFGFCVDFEKSNDYINFVATDLYKIIICNFPYAHGTADSEEKNIKRVVIHHGILFLPKSSFNSVRWFISNDVVILSIQTEDYLMEDYMAPMHTLFPSYIQAIPDKDSLSESFGVYRDSLREAFAAAKKAVDSEIKPQDKNKICIDASDAGCIKLVCQDIAIPIDAKISRPMRINMNWNVLSAVFGASTYLTFLFSGVTGAFLLLDEEVKPAGATISTTKVLMPMSRDSDTDEWGLPVKQD